MKQFSKAIILVVSLVCISQAINAQTFHLIMFCNTTDAKIGESCFKDHDKVLGEINILAEDYLGYTFKKYDFYGQECSKENLMNTLSDLNCTSKDIVFFYYSGHGVHAAADPGSFPQMCLKYDGYEQEKFVPVMKVDEMLTKKAPQLYVVLTDCCNNVADWVTSKGVLAMQKGPTMFKEEDAANYRRLLCGYKGKVIFTGSKKGQYSICNPSGGFFTNAFFDNMYEIGVGDIKPDWNSLASEVVDLTMDVSKNEQEPFYSINVQPIEYSGGSTGSGGNNGNIETVQDMLNALANSTVSSTERAKMINKAKAMFTDDAKIQTVGRNMTTTLDYESVDNYLNRISLSQKMKGVKVIKEDADSNGKYRYLVVHEIYNE